MTTKRILLALIVTAILAALVTATDAHYTPSSKRAKCTTASLEGGWGYSFGGVVTAGPFAGPYVVGGRAAFDGNGNLSGADTGNSNGQIFARTYTGTYTVNPDCTGSATITDNVGNTIHFNFVIVDGGKEMLFVQTDPEVITIGSLKRQ